jgi:serine-type D-Ala-D-Ala carboxypeptidase/endopeptidase (penicillin-binding protein 4)
MKKVFGFLQWLLLIALVGVTGCSATKTRFSAKKLSRRIEHNPVFAQSHCGFVVYDLAAQQTIYSYNGDRYFTRHPTPRFSPFTLRSASWATPSRRSGT